MHFYLSLLQNILAQVDRDDSVIRLVKTMDDVYSFVEEADPMKKIDSLGQILELMAQQTTECAYFIRDYATNKDFCMSVSVLRGKDLTAMFNTRETNTQEQFSVRC
jgi:hypothetical protein